MAVCLSSWYSLSFSVWLGATTMDSPVWIPSGSRFSMLHTCEGRAHEVTAIGSKEGQEAASQGPIASGDVLILGVRTPNSQRPQPCPAWALSTAHAALHDCLSPITHRDTVAIGVSHHLILNLLPSFKGLVYQHLAGMGKSWGHKSRQLLFVRGKA